MIDAWSKYNQPTFLINKERAVQNIQRIAKKCDRSKINFRPHFKTHQSTIVGTWFQDQGVRKICVSSVEMAKQFNDAGWKDISIVFPFNRREISLFNTLLEKASIQILVEDMETVAFLESNLRKEVGVFIKIDAGYKRTGIEASKISEIQALARSISKSSFLELKGILSHFGNHYNLNGIQEISAAYHKSIDRLLIIRDRLSSEFPDLTISVGDTPSVSLVDDFGDIDEMRPGNFVFYDWMQYEIGSCSLDQIAAIMLCPVVAKHSNRNELVTHGGAVHFSKEKAQHYGVICDVSKGFSTEIIDGCYVKSLSQEHGIIHCTDEFFKEVEIGGMIGVIPIHSCLTANLMKENTTVV